MDVIRTLPIDPVALVALGAILLASVLLVVAGGSRLPTRWWAGALVSGAIVLGVVMVIVLAVSSLDSGDAPLRGVRWWAVAAAAAGGFLAGTDVQLLIGIVRRVQGGTPTIIAGALLGPLILIGAFLLLVR